MSVVKVKGGYKVKHCHGGKGHLSKRPLSKQKAQAQHRAVRANKKEPESANRRLTRYMFRKEK